MSEFEAPTGPPQVGEVTDSTNMLSTEETPTPPEGTSAADLQPQQATERGTGGTSTCKEEGERIGAEVAGASNAGAGQCCSHEHGSSCHGEGEGIDHDPCSHDHDQEVIQIVRRRA